MKKTLKLMLAGAIFCAGMGTVVFSGNEQTANEAKTRLEKLADLFKDKGLNSFNFLNGHDEAGITKNRATLDISEYAELTKSDDDRGGALTCIEEGKFVVYQMKPTLVGESAISGPYIWYDAVGQQMVPKIVKALSESPDGWATVRSIEKTHGVNNPRQGLPTEERVHYLAVRSDVLLGKKNDTGKKFFCVAQFRSFEPVDQGDLGDMETRGDSPDNPRGNKPYGKHHKKHHAKKHHHKAPSGGEDKEGHAESAAAA